MLEIGGVCQRKFYFNLLHWAWTAEPDSGSHAESLASAAAGSGYAKLIFKPTAVYSWIFNLAIFHFIVTQSLTWKCRLLIYNIRPGGRLSEKLFKWRTSCYIRQDTKSVKL